MLPRTIDNKEVNIIAKPNSHWVINIIKFIEHMSIYVTTTIYIVVGSVNTRFQPPLDNYILSQQTDFTLNKNENIRNI